MADKKFFYDNLTILNKRIIRFRLHLAFFLQFGTKKVFETPFAVHNILDLVT